MHLPRCLLGAAVFGSLMLFAPMAVALEAIQEGTPARQEFAQAVQQLFSSDDFATLDKMAAKMRREKSRLPEGTWKLASFYAAFAPTGTQRTKLDWPAWLQRFERWAKESSDPSTAQIAFATALLGYAWEARGGGYANTVSNTGWKLFEDRVKEAAGVLRANPELKKCPGYYAAMMTVALGQGWPRDEYEKLYREAVALAPDYETFYFRKANFVAAKWYGTTPDEWHRFALEASDATEQEQGMSIYARIVWSVVGTGMANVKAFREAGIDWSRLRRGFEDLAKAYPDSLWNQNAFCFYAFAADDRETARQLFENLQGRYAPGIWGSAQNFERAERWAKQTRRHVPTP